MALINPNTGSTQFKAIIRRDAIISLVGEEPTIISEAEAFGIKLVADASNGEELSHKNLKEVPDEEIGEDGFWIHSQAARLKTMSQEELIAMVLELQGKSGATPAVKEVVEKDAPATTEEEDTVEEHANEEGIVEEVTEAPKKKKKRKVKPAEEEVDTEEEEEEVAF